MGVFAALREGLTLVIYLFGHHVQRVSIKIVCGHPLTLQYDNSVRLETGFCFIFPPGTLVLFSLNSPKSSFVHHVVPYGEVNSPTKRSRVHTETSPRRFFLIGQGFVNLRYDKLFSPPHIGVFWLKRPIITAKSALCVKSSSFK